LQRLYFVDLNLVKPLVEWLKILDRDPGIFVDKVDNVVSWVFERFLEIADVDIFKSQEDCL
jgi:hypothetical protein